MEILEIKLRQHSPLIHFHDQEGATIRATEIKPKLDKFLVGLKLDNLKALECKVSVSEKGKSTSDENRESVFFEYQVIILPAEPLLKPKKIEKDSKEYPTFFGAMGEKYKDNPKYISLTKNEIILKFKSHYPEIIGAIRTNICHFFAQTNFGTRQSKGFGSFYPLASTELGNAFQPISSFMQECLVQNYNFGLSIIERFSDIEMFYKILKSGFNFPHHPKVDGKLDYSNRGTYNYYIKSFLSTYYLNRSIGNEKYFVKQYFFKKENRIQDDGLKKFYIRSVLGVADNFEFRGEKWWGKIDVSSTHVERFKSPIQFKIFENTLYVRWTNELLPINTEFLFEERRKGSAGRPGQLITSKIINSPAENIDYQQLFVEYLNFLEEEKKRFNSHFISKTNNLHSALMPLSNFFNRLNLTYNPLS